MTSLCQCITTFFPCRRRRHNHRPTLEKISVSINLHPIPIVQMIQYCILIMCVMAFEAWTFCPPLSFSSTSNRYHGFAQQTYDSRGKCCQIYETSNSDGDTEKYSNRETSISKIDLRPQVFSTGYSTNPNLDSAIKEAVESALSSLPPRNNIQSEIDLAFVVASSLYEEPSSMVSKLIQAVETCSVEHGYTSVKHVVGNTAGGVIGCRSIVDGNVKNVDVLDASQRDYEHSIPIKVFEAESVPAVSVTLALLPDVTIKTFHLTGDDIPEFDGDLTRGMGKMIWKRVVGMSGFDDTQVKEEDPEEDPIFMIIPSPAFQNNLDDLLRGLSYAFPKCQLFGGVASTVSSLSRARIFAYSASATPNVSGCVHGNGCVGVMLQGDIQVDTMIAQGAKPVGGVYRVVAGGAQSNNDEGTRSTISAIVLDESATSEEVDSEEEEEEDELTFDEKALRRAKLSQEYAKARIPKPPLAEANFLMRRLSDVDQAFMRRALLIGLERCNLSRTPNELVRLAKGEGHRFTVRQVASAGMKDGSVTFPLGSVNVEVGARCRFFVRDGDFARKEVEALWTGYKKKELERTMIGTRNVYPPTACMVFPTLDRGTKLFGKLGYESGVVSDFLSGISSISGCFTNGVLGQLDDTIFPSNNDVMLHGSSTQYVIFRSRSKRPIYSPYRAKLEAAAKAEDERTSLEYESEITKQSLKVKRSTISESQSAPRSANGELIVRRREIHSGRSLSVSTVEWSVAEKMGKPTSALEGFMWEKETQVDRQRERISLAMLLSQCKTIVMDPKQPKPRDWIGPIKQASDDGKFVIIPECKRLEPSAGSLRKRYDITKLVKQVLSSGVPAISVNSDGVLFGGSIDDITKARDASNSASVSKSLESGDGIVAPPVLASDLLLYPYQLYKLRLAGADAVSLMVGALANKDLLYLTKIAATINLQVIASVTSEVQINMLTSLGPGSISALVLSNRDLETFDFDNTGKQALVLLQSEALSSFKQKYDVPILVEGRVGIIEKDGSQYGYIKALKNAGAIGAIVGGGIACINDDDVAASIADWMSM